jgi:hypothetical protein
MQNKTPQTTTPSFQLSLFFFLYLFFVSPAQATIVSTTLLTRKLEQPNALVEEKEDGRPAQVEQLSQNNSVETDAGESIAKFIGMLGDKHCYCEFQNLNREHITDDKKHKKSILSALTNLAHAPEKTGILIEANSEKPNELDQKTYTMAQKYGYAGMYVDLPGIARENNYQNGNVSYIPFDIRSRATNSPTQLINSTLDLMAMNYGDRYSFETIPTNKLIRLLEQTQQFAPNDTTIQKYLDALDSAMARMLDSAPYQVISELASSARELFNSSDPAQTVDQFFIDMAHRDIDAFRGCLYDLFLPLNSALGSASLQVSLEENISKFDRILVIPGQNHLVLARKLLLDRYDAQIEQGPQEIIEGDPEAVPAISNHTIQDFLRAFSSGCTQVIAAQPATPTCFACHENPGTQACGRCKIAKYCSRACQKNDWKTHKKQCRLAHASE